MFKQRKIKFIGYLLLLGGMIILFDSCSIQTSCGNTKTQAKKEAQDWKKVIH